MLKGIKSLPNPQLSVEIYEEAVSTLAQAIEPSENNIVEQTSEVLSTTADYSTELAMFVGDSSVDINNTVRFLCY